MLDDTARNHINKELLAWLDAIPFSKSTKNLTRDFSDAVLIAELLKVYYPRHVELHNYAPASSLHAKTENWNTLNRKVLVKLDLKLTKDTIHHLVNASQGAIEKLLWELRMKILGEGEDICGSRLKCNRENADVKSSKKEIGDESLDDNDSQPSPPDEIKDDADTDKKNPDISSRFSCFKQKISVAFSWLFRLCFVWNIFAIYCKLCRHSKCDAVATNVTTAKQIEAVIDEAVPRTIYAELRQELREKEEIICSLNHKIAYLESSMKLKDLRISSLMEQVPQNAIETDQMMKSRLSDGVRSKLRLRSHNLHEIKTN